MLVKSVVGPKQVSVMKEYRIKISRYNPEVDDRPILKEYKVPCIEQGTVLEALQFVYEEIDSTLLFNYGCRYKVCGKCAIKIGGKPGLACDTPLEDNMVLEPLDNFPVIRDLSVDRSGLLEPLRKHDILLSSTKETKVAIQPPEFFQLVKCNECLACFSNCPVFAQGVGYDGPFFGVKLTELYYDVRDEKNRLGQLESYLNQCILCKQCGVDCPWDVDFSRIITRVLGELNKQKGISIRDWLISHPCLIGSFANFSPLFFNFFTKDKLVRKMLDRLMKIDERAPFPKYRASKIKPQKRKENREKRKVAYFLGCYDKFYDPTKTKSSLFVLDSNNVKIKMLDLGCCGLPLIGIGKLESAKKRAITISRELEKLILDDYDIIISCTSCGAMIKNEYPTLFNQLEGKGFQSRIYDIGNYLWQMYKSNELNINFKEIRMRIGYHVPCHLKVQKIGKPFVNLLGLIPGLEIKEVFEKCCGMAGTMGLKKEKFDLSKKVGNPLINEVKDSRLDFILSDCPSCRMRIEKEAVVKTLHPISILSESMQ